MTEYKNEKQYELAIKEYLSDLTMNLTTLSKKYGFDRGCFSRYVRRHGIEVRQTNICKNTADRYSEGTKLYEQGYSINQISTNLNINRKNFGLFLKKKGIAIRGGYKKKEHSADNTFFEKIDLAAKAYWLGFVYADGCIVSNVKTGTYRLTIELNRIDRLHLEKFRSALKSNVEIKDRANRPTSSICINSKKIVEDLIALGCVPNKTNYGWIDLSILKNHETDFLRGYLDGDGFIEKNHKKYRVVYTVKSLNMTNALMEMLLDYKPRVENCSGFNRIHIETKDAFFRLLSDLYLNANTYLFRKYYTCMDRIHAHSSTTLQKA